jgi:hypothetical protein
VVQGRELRTFSPMHGLIAELQYFLLQATTVREGVVTALKVRDVNLFAFVSSSSFFSIY